MFKKELKDIKKEKIINRIASLINRRQKMIDTGSIKNVYAAWSLEKDERKTSASGGVASVFIVK